MRVPRAYSLNNGRVCLYGLHTPDGVDTHENITVEFQSNVVDNDDMKKKSLGFACIFAAITIIPISNSIFNYY